MKKLLSLVAVLLVATGMALGQANTGTLVGIVHDNTGAAIPNAPVTAVNIATGVAYPGKTNSTGEYRIQYLPAGKYDVKSSASGFAATTLKGLDVQASLNQTGDLTLSASTSTSVDVTSEATVSIDTTSATLGTTFSMVETQDLPVTTSGSGVINLALLSPGVGSSGGIGAGTGGSISGQRPRNNNFEIDGYDNNNKSVTGPFVYVPNDAVGNFVLLENIYGAQYGHSTGGQFNGNIVTGTNKLHGRFYEYFDNRNLNAVDPIQGRANVSNGVSPHFLPRYDFNRYGGQLGGAVLKNKLFLFSNFERQTLGSVGTSASYCAPTAAGFTALNSLTFASAQNYAVYKQYSPVAGAQAPAAGDAGCPNGNTIAVTGTNNVTTNIPVGDFSVQAPSFYNHYYSTTSGDYIISSKDSLHVRYVYNRQDGTDTSATLPVFFIGSPLRYHLAGVNETHIFTANLSNDFRVGYNRFFNKTPVNSTTFPSLSVFPNLVFDELGYFNLGPDGNAPQGTITNLYQAIDSLTWVKGKHTIVVGGEARKSIAPELFVQRARGDYEYSTLNFYLNDLSPDVFGQRNALGAVGTPTFYGDQTAFYGYANDDYRVTPKLTVNLGLRYEFTSVPASEKLQALNSAASAAGYNFGVPQPQYKNFAPRIGFAYAPDANTSFRGGFTMGYDVLYDNIGTTEAPPQFQSTLSVNTSAPQTSNFLASGGLPGTFSFTTLAQQRAATTAFIPNQKLPYAESFTLGIEHVFMRDYTAEVRYVGTLGRHLDVQDRTNIISPVTPGNALPTAFGGSTFVTQNGNSNLTLLKGSTTVPNYISPASYAAGFTNSTGLVADEPYGSSSYNGLQTQLTRRFQRGLLLNASYTWSKTMDTATADFNTSATNPRRPQDFQNIAADYGLSALSRKHRLTIAALYDLPYFKNSNWFLKNLVGNLEVAPIYTFQSPQYTTVQSGVDSNLNGDSAADRALANTIGVKGTGATVVPIYNPALPCVTFTGAATTPATYSVANGTTTVAKACGSQIIGYAEGSLTAAHAFVGSNAYYVQAGAGTLPNVAKNTLPTGRTNNIDVSAYKRFNIFKESKVEFGVQAFNVLNHPQYQEGAVDDVGSFSSTGYRGFDTVSTPATFNQKQLIFPASVRSLQLSGKIIF